MVGGLDGMAGEYSIALSTSGPSVDEFVDPYPLGLPLQLISCPSTGDAAFAQSLDVSLFFGGAVDRAVEVLVLDSVAECMGLRCSFLRLASASPVAAAAFTLNATLLVTLADYPALANDVAALYSYLARVQERAIAVSVRMHALWRAEGERQELDP